MPRDHAPAVRFPHEPITLPAPADGVPRCVRCGQPLRWIAGETWACADRRQARCGLAYVVRPDQRDPEPPTQPEP